MTKDDLLATIERDRESHLTFLQEFIREPSPNPPGDTRLAAGVVTRYLKQHDIEPSIIAPREDLPNVVSEFNGARGGRRLVLNGHIDVFPVGDGKGWSRDPWSGVVEDGFVHGRGACDMKAGTAASVIAFSYLHAYRAALAGSVGLTAVSDEETGGRWGSRWLLENDTRWHGDCMLNAEPSSLQTIRFAEKGTLRLTFTVHTAGAHGAYLHKSESATRVAASLIARLAQIEAIVPDLSPSLRAYLALPEVRAAADRAMGAGAADIMASPTLNIGTVHGGLKVNMIPDSCVFEADMRLPIGLDAGRVMQTVHTILADYPQAEVAIQEAASNPSSSCAHDHPMVGILASNAEAVSGIRPVAIPSLGATDCKFWRYHKVPAYIYGPAPTRMAAVDECVSVEEFITVIKTHALSAWDYLNGGN
ncbi:Succinyl-diaminopimelate desuccinylase [Paraburkholderia aspalathi]|uniref:ArgE/DapE family deacylase n=1 Tax=Paraburkholderia aspalathi TaxID=1324617 RepID=UPI00190B0E06|nr:ArgE/DapE family deacylase [Paraburkholderia aspalathi]MBK3844086.1 M20 family metallopeptidase [Paraburkholderia aspalathi]CAE6866723.1 Succinyl-diaminopimelate desuccinylase [Paraburkholderia aspalathi]